MNASDGLLGILLIDFVASLATLFGDGQNAGTSERLNRIGRFGMD